MAGSSPTTDSSTRHVRSTCAPSAPALIALVGNPNTGKTSLFNALTGFQRRVANYPGVTVEVARGPLRGATQPIELLDLPGTYSLAAQSPDEAVVSQALHPVDGRRDALRASGAPVAASHPLAAERRPNCILAILDASNLSRNLYLLSQLLERGLPIVVALNMVDIARRRGIEVDAEALSQRLGCAVIPVVAINPGTLPPLIAALQAALGRSPAPQVPVELPAPVCAAVAQLRSALPSGIDPTETLRILLDRDGHWEQQFIAAGGSRATLDAARATLTTANVDGAAAEVRARYAWITRVLDGVIRRPSRRVQTWSDRFDLILTHRFWGAIILVIVLTLCFQALFRGATPLMDGIEAGFQWLSALVAPLLPEGVLRSLVIDGLIAGVGGVVVFLPQIMILFLFIALLEDCGYMARAAFMVDRLMRGLGLSGRSFIPLLSSFACAIPAIMGTRVIADRRERFVTILIAPFMSCSARLPVYVLMIAAFVPATTWLGGWFGLQGLVMLAAYLVGVVVAIPIAWLLRRTAFKGPATPFLMELPTYKRPRLRAVWQRMWSAGRSFLVRAGTVILAVNMVVWALAYFPHSPATAQRVQSQATAAGWNDARLERELDGAYLRDSFLGRLGHAIEPAIKPIGWDWRIGMAVIASFPAREVIVGTLGTIYNLGPDVDPEAEASEAEATSDDESAIPLREALREARWPDTGAPVFTLPVALSLMVFFALCAQCASTLVIIGREMQSWVWPAISFAGMTGLAYVAALAIAVAARALGA